jgi:hypothetical protein
MEMELKPMSMVVPQDDRYTSVYGVKGTFIYLGEIPNKVNYCALLSNATGRMHVFFDSSRLRVLDENES